MKMDEIKNHQNIDLEEIKRLKNELNNQDYQALLIELKLIQNQLNKIGA